MAQFLLLAYSTFIVVQKIQIASDFWMTETTHFEASDWLKEFVVQKRSRFPVITKQVVWMKYHWQNDMNGPFHCNSAPKSLCWKDRPVWDIPNFKRCWWTLLMKKVLATDSKIFPTRHEVFRQWVHSFLRAAFCTLRGAFAHLRTTPSRSRARDVRNECTQFLCYFWSKNCFHFHMIS